MKKSIFNINIYKPDAKKKKEWKLPSVKIYSSLLILISFLLLLGVLIYIILGLYIPQKRNLNNALSKADKLDLKLQRIKTHSINLASKKDLYLQLRGEAISWPEKLIALSQNLPENIWFSRIEFPGRSGKIEGGQNILISGQTFSGLMEENLDQIGELLLGLNRTETFKDDFEPLHLEYTQKSETDWGIIHFRITGKTKELPL